MGEGEQPEVNHHPDATPRMPSTSEIKANFLNQLVDQSFQATLRAIELRQNPAAQNKERVTLADNNPELKIPQVDTLRQAGVDKAQFLNALIFRIVITMGGTKEEYGNFIQMIQSNGLDGNKPVNNFYYRLPGRENTYLAYGYSGSLKVEEAISNYRKAREIMASSRNLVQDQDVAAEYMKKAAGCLVAAIVWEDPNKIEKLKTDGSIKLQ